MAQTSGVAARSGAHVSYLRAMMRKKESRHRQSSAVDCLPPFRDASKASIGAIAATATGTTNGSIEHMAQATIWRNEPCSTGSARK